jgi:hypothetical protein
MGFYTILNTDFVTEILTIMLLREFLFTRKFTFGLHYNYHNKMYTICKLRSKLYYVLIN